MGNGSKTQRIGIRHLFACSLLAMGVGFMTAALQTVEERRVLMREADLNAEQANSVVSLFIDHRLFTAGTAAGVIVAVFAFVMHRTFIRPLVSLNRQAAALSQGDLETKIDVAQRGDVGNLVDTLEDLRLSLRQSYDDLFEQNDRLSQLDHLKDDMIGTASHEMRTPLTTIRGFTKLLAGGKGGELTPIQQDMVGMIDRNVDRLQALVSDLLVVERVDKAPLTSTPVNLGILAEEVMRDHEAVAREKGLGLIQSVPAHTEVMADRERLREVLINLVSNAVKYTPRGSVTVRSRHMPDRITLEVQDTGIGIPSHLQEHVFDRFYRADDEYVRERDGSGLGLAIVKRLVTRLNGTVSVTSEPGRGSTFRVTLPKAADNPVERAEMKVDDRLPLIVATDDSHAQTMWGAVLPSDRFRVSFARSSAGILMRSRREPPCAIIVDLDDPELVDRIRSRKSLSDVGFVVLREGHDRDGVVHLPRSADPDLLLAAVDRVCDAPAESKEAA